MKLPVIPSGLLACTLLLLAPEIQAREPERSRQQSDRTETRNGTRAAQCPPATGLTDLSWNNVRALVETAGSMWQNRAQGEARYEIPKGGGVSSMYSGALWMGGIARGTNQLKLAAHDFRQGNDFWPGPLTRQAAEVDENTCLAYDRFWVNNRQDIAKHRAYFECKNDPTCNENEEFPGYVIPQTILDWPAHGVGDQDYYLAPFYDYDNGGLESQGGTYDPQNGDYPAFDLFNELPCGTRTRETRVPLYGDINMWWVFNDKGNVHSETDGEPIGMEIRAQAFAFASNDELNNMTFYNYVLINQGTNELQDAIFAQWADPDVGYALDDYVGCDVQRGLGYAYNADPFDQSGSGSLGYGANPPAVGIDFFEGPFQDADGIDNPLTLDYQEAIDLKGIPYEGLGTGYGDDFPDNERLGMRKFLYYNNGTDPEDAPEYWAYMNGRWPSNNTDMVYGGDGFDIAGEGIKADFMFPDDSDPIGWGTGGQVQGVWNEENDTNSDPSNPSGDRRFIQSAGPFTLEPGARNNITVGVVWTPGTGVKETTIAALKAADDKAQQLFNNCFRILEGPDAPDVDVVELDQELILNLSNESGQSTNFHESYAELDPTIPETLVDGTELTVEQREYRFQGYQVYQLLDASVSPADLQNPDLARLVLTTDIVDDVTHIVNYEYDTEYEVSMPIPMADGTNSGVQHSISITEDAFALDDSRLVNHRTYYFMVLAYGHNEYAPYNSEARTGQDKPYIASRKAAFTPLRVYSGIPHKVDPENGGTSLGAVYGQRIPVTQTEGRGNGLLHIELDASTRETIMSGAPWRAEARTYTAEHSPVTLTVVDPKALVSGDFILHLNPENTDWEAGEVSWELLDAETGDVLHVARHHMDQDFEELIPDLGISIRIPQHAYSDSYGHYTPPVFAEVDYAEGSVPWLVGMSDADGLTEVNWIRAGSQTAPDEAEGFEAVVHDMWPPNLQATNPIPFNDPEEQYEGLIGGTWAPYCVTAYSASLGNGAYYNVAPRTESLASTTNVQYAPRIRDLNNVDIVLTPNRDLWTRCPVLEMQANPAQSEGGVAKMALRAAPSVDKDGLNVSEGGDPEFATLDGAQPTGMGWFPGYAIDLETGERLNMAFGEDSYLTADNGNDMCWNPSDRVTSALGDVVAGGQHWIYVFENTRHTHDGDEGWVPGYDDGQHLYQALGSTSNAAKFRTWKSCTWVGNVLSNPELPLRSAGQGVVPSTCTVRLRVAQPYGPMRSDAGDVEDLAGSSNNWNPRYFFSTRGLEAQSGQTAVLDEALACIQVVPNPYYAFSQYEANKLDNRVKITNLPEACTVTIFNVNGTLVRQYDKSDPLTSLDWDLKNHRNVPIASGVYLIHVHVPGVGERVLKWFGVLRPTDLDNF